MFEKQDELNIHTNGPEWKTNNDLKWYRAIWTECAELIDYTDWKWWKKQDILTEDIKMELIDIWHFALSDMLKHSDIDKCTDNVFFSFRNDFEQQNTINFINVQEATEILAYGTLRDMKFVLEKFIKLCSTLNMNINQIYKLYMGKNILNRFRQDHGYKQKTYIKMWNGHEDNYYLMKFLEETDVELNFDTSIYIKLEEMYECICLVRDSTNVT